MDKIIGLDIGTTNIKGELYDTDGKLIDSLSYSYGIYFDKNNQAEQNAEDWLEITVKILNYFFEKYKDIKAAGLSTQGGTIVPVDKDINPLRKAITWMDARAGAQKDFILKKISADKIYKITGWKLQSFLPLLQLCWIKENEKNIFDNTYKYMFVNDFVQEKLCGNSYVDYSNASITMLFDIVKKDWSEELLEIIEIDRSKLSETNKSDLIIGNFKNKKLSKNCMDISFSNSAHDQYCVALSSNILNDNKILLSTGTSWAIFANTQKPYFNKYYYSPGVHILPEKYGLISVVPTAGSVFNWFLNNFFEKEESKINFLKNIEEDGEKILSLKNDCIFIPLFQGSFGPIWNDNIRGSFENLSFDITRINLFKAILEGVAFQVKWIFNSMIKLGIKIDSIKMIGGAVKSRLQTQILSDITGLPVYLPKNMKLNYACKGAAMLAGVSAKIYKDFKIVNEIFKEEELIVYPREEFKDYYLEKFNKYLEIINKNLQA
ncbi:MAG: FGGY family carbohydrate kinase [Actinobacteria bacterium]|nr:FGGY family carbohydrate kinase [Cyanobacteriota bacterium]MCL5771467.1 FGGY family carbohydrate kinase [Actinomycetota bacterium]